jgi:hypothetical protein
MVSIAPLVRQAAVAHSEVQEVVDMVSPYLTQVLAEAHVDDLRRAATRSGQARRPRRRRSTSLPRIRDWWAGQLRRPAGGTARVALPGRPAPLAVCTAVCTSVGR